MPTLLEVENVSQEMNHFFKSDNMEDDEGWMEQPTHCPGLLKHYSRKILTEVICSAGQERTKGDNLGLELEVLILHLFFAAFPMQPWAKDCSFLSLVFPIQQLKIILSTLMLAETLSSLVSKILYMNFYKVHFFPWFPVPRTDTKRTEGTRES